MNTRQGTYVRTDTHRATLCLCQTSGYQCSQGRQCPLRDTELANTIPPREELPKVNKSNYTGRAHRSMASAFNPYCDNRLHPMPDTTPTWLERLVILFVKFTGMPK